MTIAEAVGVKIWPWPIKTPSANVTNKAPPVVVSTVRCVPTVAMFATNHEGNHSCQSNQDESGRYKGRQHPKQAGDGERPHAEVFVPIPVQNPPEDQCPTTAKASSLSRWAGMRASMAESAETPAI